MEILRPLSPNLESLGEQGKRSAVDDRISTRVNGRMVVFAGLECTMMSRGRDWLQSSFFSLFFFLRVTSRAHTWLAALCPCVEICASLCLLDFSLPSNPVYICMATTVHDAAGIERTARDGCPRGRCLTWLHRCSCNQVDSVENYHLSFFF